MRSTRVICATRALFVACLFSLSLLWTAPRTWAQPKARASQQRKVASPSARLRARMAQRKPPPQKEAPKAGGGKVIEFKQLSVEGTVQRPSASYFLQRRKLKFRGIEPKKSFVPEILSSAKRYPF